MDVMCSTYYATSLSRDSANGSMDRSRPIECGGCVNGPPPPPSTLTLIAFATAFQAQCNIGHVPG